MHKLKYLRKRTTILGGAIFITAVFILLIAMNLGTNRLSPAEISDLRHTYPIYGIEVPANMSMREPTFTEIKELSDTYVYGTVVGDFSTYTKNASTGIPELDVKRESHGLNLQYTFYEYTIRVIQDTDNRYSPGEEITIASNIELINYNPKLENGMKVVVPVIQDKEKKTRASFSVVGMYYVTENDYVLSVFEETNAKMKPLTGIQVDSLMKTLAK